VSRPRGASVDGTERRRAATALVVAIVALAAFDVLRGAVLPSVLHVPASVAMAFALIAVARAGGADARSLGLGRGTWAPGVRLGAIAFGLVTAVLLVGAALPATRGAFADEDADTSVGGMIAEALVAIPLGTVLLEEVAFRGCLLALGRRLTSTGRAVVASSVLFGVWHLVPALAASPGAPGPLADAPRGAEALAIVGLTTLAGLAFCWLRLRSGSLVAPFLGHVATNSVAFTIAWSLTR
jgi:membrane protease YdiL (CAAX protease family)